MKTLQEFVERFNYGGWGNVVDYGLNTEEWKGTELEDFIEPVNKLIDALTTLEEVAEDHGIGSLDL